MIRRLGLLLALTAALSLGPVNGLLSPGAGASPEAVVSDGSGLTPQADRADPGQPAARDTDLAVIVALGAGFVLTAGGKAYRLRRSEASRQNR
jgi:hypothetical protein